MDLLVAALGEVLWDIFPDGPRFGGAPANVASHVAPLGPQAVMISCVGDDPYGADALVELRNRGVVTDYVRIVNDVPTGTVTVVVDDQGKPQFTIQEPAAWDRLVLTEREQELAGRCDAVCFGTLGQRDPVAREAIQQFIKATPARSLRVCDVNLRPPFVDPLVIRQSLELANVLKLSDDELDTVARAAGCSGEEPAILAELLDNWDLHLIAVTRGSRGATLLSNGERSDCDGVPVQVVDTVGAGDAFVATLTCGLLHGDPLKMINQRACRVASYVCSQSGATPELPQELLR